METIDLMNFCRDWFAAWMSNSPEKLREFYTDDAYYSDPARPQGVRGPELLPYFEKLLAKYPNWLWRALEIIPTQKGFCLKWRATFRRDEHDSEVTGMDIVELKDGKIIRNEVFFDRSALLEP